MLKGGYQIVNFSGNNLSVDTNNNIDSIFDKLNSNNKVVLISGLVIDGVEYRDIFSTVYQENDSYIIEDVYGYDITITSDNVRISFSGLFTPDGILSGEPSLQRGSYNKIASCFKRNKPFIFGYSYSKNYAVEITTDNKTFYSFYIYTSNGEHQSYTINRDDTVIRTG